MNRNRKEQLKENIDKLDSQEHEQILQIVMRHTEQYTKTNSGVLVSSDNLSDECLMEMEKVVKFYMDQRKTVFNQTQ